MVDFPFLFPTRTGRPPPTLNSLPSRREREREEFKHAVAKGAKRFCSLCFERFPCINCQNPSDYNALQYCCTSKRRCLSPWRKIVTYGVASLSKKKRTKSEQGLFAPPASRFRSILALISGVDRRTMLCYLHVNKKVFESTNVDCIRTTSCSFLVEFYVA